MPNVFLFQKRNIALVLQTLVHFALAIPFAIAYNVLMWTADTVGEDEILGYSTVDYMNIMNYLSTSVSMQWDWWNLNATSSLCVSVYVCVHVCVYV